MKKREEKKKATGEVDRGTVSVDVGDSDVPASIG